MTKDNPFRFKPSQAFFIPSEGTIPERLVPYNINIGQLDANLRSLVQSIAGFVTYINDEATWATETAHYLKKLSITVLATANLLKTVTIEVENFVENPNHRYRDYNGYFNIKECQDFDLLKMLAQDIKLFYVLVIEMAEIRMDEAEIMHFLGGARVRLETYRTFLGQTEEVLDIGFEGIFVDGSLADPISTDCRISTAFFRWFVCHYDFAQNLIHAKYQMDIALKYYDDEDYNNAAASIIKSGELIRASTSSMVLGCMMPPRIYQEYIRKSMGAGFTGLDNSLWAAFSASKKKLLAGVNSTSNSIIQNAMESLFEKLLQDIEVHTGIADKMIGNSTSLTVDEINAELTDNDKNTRPATADLRNLHYLRLKEFEFLGIYPILNKLFSKP